MRDTCLSLLSDLCALLELQWNAPPSEPGELSVGIEVDDTRFALVHDQARPAGLSVFCEFGPLPQEDSALRRLLEINLALASREAGTIGLDAGVDRVVFHFKLALRELRGPGLLAALRAAAAQATAWRDGRFAADDHAAKESTAAPAFEHIRA
jgi:hypothetical protein